MKAEGQTAMTMKYLAVLAGKDCSRPIAAHCDVCRTGFQRDATAVGTLDCAVHFGGQKFITDCGPRL